MVSLYRKTAGRYPPGHPRDNQHFSLIVQR